MQKKLWYNFGMKKFFCLFFALLLFSSVLADTNYKKFNNLPQGSFKRNWKGDIIQYDTNGKKIGKYKTQKIRNGKIK